VNSSCITTICSLSLAAIAVAAEVPIEPKPFFIESSFSAKVVPQGDGTSIAITPKAWKDFELTKIAAHGSSVNKGDLLMAFDAENLDRAIADTKRSLESSTLALETSEHQLAVLKETSPHRLESKRRAAAIAKEEHAYFTKTDREAKEIQSKQQLERTIQYLENQQEELKQLEQMYAADDLTEETEEIILVRQKNDVRSAEIMVKMQTLAHNRTIEVQLPREAVNMANTERDTAIALTNIESQLPRDIKTKEDEIEGLKVNLKRLQESLAKHEQDRSLFEITAPADGEFYYGDFAEGEWITGDMIKTLVPNARPPQNRTIATFIPKDTKRILVAHTSAAIARPLSKGLQGVAYFSGREDLLVDVTVQSIANSPDPKGRYRVELTAKWPKELTPAIGDSAKIKLISYENDAAILVPDKALSFGPKGWSVELKLADGKTESRNITRGRQSNGKTEILKGLETGQVVITPGS